MAEKEEAEEDPEEEQTKLEAILKEAEEERARALKEFEERERLWIQAMELKKKEEEEEEEEVRRKLLEEEESKRQLQVEKETECDEDDDCEYVEEGPAEIIWQGNEIIIKKKKVRIPKKDANLLTVKEVSDRPTSNPLPPQSEAFADHKSAQQALASVAQQVPNFGTEQDKAHCPFHLKTGACRFGQSCSRVHFYPDKSCTLLIKNMYNGPGLAWEQDEGLEYTDEEVECAYEEFYEDVHTEFLKFGEIVNFKVCKNGSFHLRGNVYVHYKSLESAVMAYQSVNGRYFAGKQVICEFVNVTRWKVAICGEYMKSRFKTCSHGTACNFIHCFRNPGGDYEWADWDKPVPKFWVKKIAALFGYSAEYGYEKQVDQDNVGPRRNSSKFTVDSDRCWSRRSRSRDVDRVKGDCGSSCRDENDLEESTRSQKCIHDYRKRFELDDRSHKESTELKDYHNSESRSNETDFDRIWMDRDGDKYRDRHHGHRKKSTRHESMSSRKSADYVKKTTRTHEADSIGNWWDGDIDTQVNHDQTKTSGRFRDTRELQDDNGDHKNRIHEAHFDRQDRDEDGGREHSYQGRRNDDEFSGEKFDRDRDRDRGRHRSHERKSLGKRQKVLKSQDGYSFGKYRSFNTDSGDDWWDSDVETHHSHRRKRSRSRIKDLEFSDDQAESTQKLKEKLYNKESTSERSNHERLRKHRHSSKRSRSGKEHDADHRHLKSEGGHESSGPGHYDERFISRNKHDHWESESPDEDQFSRRKASSVQSTESNSPGRYDGRDKSPSESNSPGRYDGGKSLDLASEYCNNDIDDNP